MSLRKKTLHFHIAKTGLFMGNYFRIQGVPRNDLAPVQKLYFGYKVG